MTTIKVTRETRDGHTEFVNYTMTMEELEAWAANGAAVTVHIRDGGVTEAEVATHSWWPDFEPGLTVFDWREE